MLFATVTKIVILAFASLWITKFDTKKKLLMLLSVDILWQLVYEFWDQSRSYYYVVWL